MKAAPEPLLRLQNVSKCYLSGNTCEIFPVLDVSLEVRTGERIILLGKSGSGKSTFLNLVGGVDSPTSGRIFFDDREITRLGPRRLAEYRRREIGFVFQSFNLFPTLTVGENVTLPLDLLGTPNEKAARDLLDAVGLAGQWDKFPEQLSGGEQQRVGIARALIKKPRLICADEPTGNLDLETGDLILHLIYDVCRAADATLIMATHSSEALWLAHRVFTLKAGALIEERPSGTAASPIHLETA